jgi:low affinity Fe/Cu permease
MGRRARGWLRKIEAKDPRLATPCKPELEGDMSGFCGMSEPHKSSWSFSNISRHASSLLGTSRAFIIACAIVVVWAVSGPIFGYSDTWQLVTNTGTTIVTFLMVFLVQHTQNRDARALHLKLDELLRSMDAARNRLIDLENCTDEEIDQIERQFVAFKSRGQRSKISH